jgi:integrase
MRIIVEARVLGPYAEKDRWRISILEKGARRSEYLATRPEARKRISQLKKQQGKAEAFTVGIDSGKTRNAKRHLRIPEFIRPHLRKPIESQLQDTFVILSDRTGVPFHYRSLWATVQRLCQLAGTTAVCTHSLRGLYATLASELRAERRVDECNCPIATKWFIK